MPRICNVVILIVIISTFKVKGQETRFVLFLNMRSSAILCSRSTSSLTFGVQFQFSRTQVQRTHESARMCSDIEDALSADLRESSR